MSVEKPTWGEVAICLLSFHIYGRFSDNTRHDNLIMSHQRLTGCTHYRIRRHTPLGHFLAQYRLAWLWQEMVEEAVQESANNAELLNPINFIPWPTEEDLNGAATGLCRLQLTYNLSAAEMVALKRYNGLQVEGATEGGTGRRCPFRRLIKKKKKEIKLALSQCEIFSLLMM